MKKNIFLIVFFALSLVACNNSAGDSQKVAPEVVPENANWESFWANFQSSITKNDIGGLVNLTALPLVTNALTDKNAKGLSKVGLITNFPKIFNEAVKERILSAKAEEWRTVVVNEENQAKLLGAPIGTEVKSLQLNFITDEGKENQTETSRIFSFAKIKKEYQWCSMIIAG